MVSCVYGNDDGYNWAFDCLGCSGYNGYSGCRLDHTVYEYSGDDYSYDGGGYGDDYSYGDGDENLLIWVF